MVRRTSVTELLKTMTKRYSHVEECSRNSEREHTGERLKPFAPQVTHFKNKLWTDSMRLNSVRMSPCDVTQGSDLISLATDKTLQVQCVDVPFPTWRWHNHSSIGFRTKVVPDDFCGGGCQQRAKYAVDSTSLEILVNHMRQLLEKHLKCAWYGTFKRVQVFLQGGDRLLVSAFQILALNVSRTFQWQVEKNWR